jgi:RsiW-degrading membrane proteinase PrsW (M82 family)
LCDTNNEFTHSGLKNNGKVLANLAHIVLSLTMMSFFYVMPNIFNHSNRNTKLIKILGALAMAIFTFMYQEELHDLVVTLVGVFASMAFLPIFIELVKYKNRPFKILTYIVFIMSLALYLGFETKVGIYYMPFLQKFVFMVDATLVYWTAIIVIRKNNRGLEA